MNRLHKYRYVVDVLSGTTYNNDCDCEGYHFSAGSRSTEAVVLVGIIARNCHKQDKKLSYR